nr:HIT family protein [Campylobacter mucosalis]
MQILFEDEFIKIEREPHELPWVKIFTKTAFKELSDCDEKSRARLFEVMLIAEREMIKFYKPAKINIASFGNMLPQVHIHVIARFENDEFFPQSVWGESQRKSSVVLPNFDEFAKKLQDKLNEK